jgi:hypothetical protein
MEHNKSPFPSITDRMMEILTAHDKQLDDILVLFREVKTRLDTLEEVIVAIEKRLDRLEDDSIYANIN